MVILLILICISHNTLTIKPNSNSKHNLDRGERYPLAEKCYYTKNGNPAGGIQGNNPEAINYTRIDFEILPVKKNKRYVCKTKLPRLGQICVTESHIYQLAASISDHSTQTDKQDLLDFISIDRLSVINTPFCHFINQR